MFSAACLLTSAAILFFVLRYRVHIHVTYAGSRPRSRAARTAAPRSTAADTELVSALRNLGCSAPAAKKAATRAAAEAPNDFNGALKLAIQYATGQAA